MACGKEPDMSRFGSATNSADLFFRFAQSADAADLAARANALLSQVPDGYSIIDITLAGAGDGHTFVVIIEAASEAVGGLPTGQIGVGCYVAAGAIELQKQRAFLQGFASGLPAGAGILDSQLAGASQGTRFMGLLVVGPTDALPAPCGNCIAQVSTQTESGLAVPQNIFTPSTASFTFSADPSVPLQVHVAADSLVQASGAGTGDYRMEVRRNGVGFPNGTRQLLDADASNLYTGSMSAHVTDTIAPASGSHTIDLEFFGISQAFTVNNLAFTTWVVK